MLLQLISYTFILILVAVAILHRRASLFKKANTQVCIILGSGGHTTQMCQLFRNFDFQKCSQIYVISGISDQLSQSFFTKYFVELCEERSIKLPQFQFIKTKRTNEVKQSKVTSILTTLLAFTHALYIIVKQLLGVTHVVSNGPGICVPYFYIFWLLNKLRVTKSKLIFVESWCRVATLSVAGRVVCLVADEYLVHWQNQVSMGKNTRYTGQII